MYKIIHGLVDLNIHNYLQFSKETRTRNSRAYKFQMPFSSKNALKFSFFPIKDLKGVESASSNLVFRAFPLKKRVGPHPFLSFQQIEVVLSPSLPVFKEKVTTFMNYNPN